MAVGAVRQGVRQMLKFLSFKGRDADEQSRASEMRARMAAVRDNIFSRLLSPVESYVVSLQSLLIWERPYLSAVALVAINCMFWLLASCSRRFYSFMAIIALIVFVYRTWVQQIWPEIRVPPAEGEEEMEGWTPVHPRVLSVPELSLYLNNVWKAVRARSMQLWDLRSTQHGAFCIIVCSILTALAIVGRLVPGVVIIYTVVMTVALGPGVILYVVPTPWYNCFRSFVAMFGSDDMDGRTAERMQQECSDSELEEYLPDTGAENLPDLSLSEHDKPKAEDVAAEDSLSLPEFPGASVARELGMESLISEEEEASLCRGLGNFPDAEEESNDNDDLDVEIPSLPVRRQSNNGMFFVPTHFREDSSESEPEEAFARGLTFRGVLEGDASAETRVLHSQRPLLTGRPHDTEALPGTSGADVPPRQSSRASDVDMNEYEIVSDADLHS